MSRQQALKSGFAGFSSSLARKGQPLSGPRELLFCDMWELRQWLPHLR